MASFVRSKKCHCRDFSYFSRERWIETACRAEFSNPFFQRCTCSAPQSVYQKLSGCRGLWHSVCNVHWYGLRNIVLFSLMSSGLAIMMGTVWLRLAPIQSSIQPFTNAIVGSPSSNPEDADRSSSLARHSCLSWPSHTSLLSSKTAQRSSRNEPMACTAPRHL